jgi:hypothetical protein
MPTRPTIAIASLLGVRDVKGEALALVGAQTLASEGAADAEGYVWYALPPVEAFEAIQLTAA